MISFSERKDNAQRQCSRGCARGRGRRSKVPSALDQSKHNRTKEQKYHKKKGGRLFMSTALIRFACAYIVRRRLFYLVVLFRIIVAVCITNLYDTTVTVADPYATERAYAMPFKLVIFINVSPIAQAEHIAAILVKV